MYSTKMGKIFAKFAEKELRIIMLGLDSAGKTSILFTVRAIL